MAFFCLETSSVYFNYSHFTSTRFLVTKLPGASSKLFDGLPVRSSKPAYLAIIDADCGELILPVVECDPISDNRYVSGFCSNNLTFAYDYEDLRP